MLGIDAKEVIQFKSVKDTGENPTVFFIRNFTNRDKLKVFGGSMNEKGQFDISKFQDRIFEVLKAGIEKIKNLAGKDYESMTEELLEAIPFDVLMELFQKIMGLNFPSEQEVKN